MFDNKYEINLKCCFLGFTKLLVANGYNAGDLNSIEVIDFSTELKTCNDLPNFPVKSRAQMGGLFNQTLPMICGGAEGIDDGITYKSECYSLKENTWAQVKTLFIRY